MWNFFWLDRDSLFNLGEEPQNFRVIWNLAGSIQLLKFVTQKILQIIRVTISLFVTEFDPVCIAYIHKLLHPFSIIIVSTNSLKMFLKQENYWADAPFLHLLVFRINIIQRKHFSMSKWKQYIISHTVF